MALIDLKRDYLRRVVDTLTGRGKLQKDIAELMEESDTTLSSRLSGSRGIPDDYIDRLQEKTGIPFMVGGGVEGVSAELLQRFVTQGEANQNLLNLLVREVRELREEKNQKA